MIGANAQARDRAPGSSGISRVSITSLQGFRKRAPNRARSTMMQPRVAQFVAGFNGEDRRGCGGQALDALAVLA
jgi:hypothetical protein